MERNSSINIEKIQMYFINKPILKTYLFGSYARKEQNEKRDIDILIEIDKTQRIDLFDFIGWQFDLESLLQKKVDLVTTDSISKFIKPYIDNDKILIYEKE